MDGSLPLERSADDPNHGTLHYERDTCVTPRTHNYLLWEKFN